MRILIISDIHANIVALEAVLEHAPDHEAVWCLGDIVGYGPAPIECIARVQALKAICLAGNHDWAAIGKLSVEDFNGDAKRAVLWTTSVLEQENKDWLEQLPARMDLPDRDLTLVHASPRHPIWEYILSPAVASENLPFFETQVCLFGHTHVPAIYAQASANQPVTGSRLPVGKPIGLHDAYRLLLNPGSVGQPRDGDPRAAYAILDTAVPSLTHFRTEYNIAATQAAMAQVNLPNRLIQRLARGA